MSNHYGSVAGFRQYCNDRELIIPAGLTDDKITATLLDASEWLDGRYRNQFPGIPVGRRAQQRHWPAENAYDVYNNVIPSNEIPIEVINATYEAAWNEVTTPNTLTKNFTASKYKSAAVSGAVSVVFDQTLGASDVQTVLPKVSRILHAVLTQNTGQHSLVGKSFRA